MKSRTMQTMNHNTAKYNECSVDGYNEIDLGCATAMWEDDKSPLPLMQHRQRAQKEI